MYRSTEESVFINDDSRCLHLLVLLIVPMQRAGQHICKLIVTELQGCQHAIAAEGVMGM